MSGDEQRIRASLQRLQALLRGGVAAFRLEVGIAVRTQVEEGDTNDAEEANFDFGDGGSGEFDYERDDEWYSDDVEGGGEHGDMDHGDIPIEDDQSVQRNGDTEDDRVESGALVPLVEAVNAGSDTNDEDDGVDVDGGVEDTAGSLRTFAMQAIRELCGDKVILLLDLR